MGARSHVLAKHYFAWNGFFDAGKVCETLRQLSCRTQPPNQDSAEGEGRVGRGGMVEMEER